MASKATVIFVTHDLEEAIYLGDRVVGLLPHPGRIGIDLADQPAAPARSIDHAREPGIPAAAPRNCSTSSRRSRSMANPRRLKARDPSGELLLALEIWARSIDIHSDALAPPSAVVLALFQAFGDLLDPVGHPRHAASAFAGLAVGGVIGLRPRNCTSVSSSRWIG